VNFREFPAKILHPSKSLGIGLVWNCEGLVNPPGALRGTEIRDAGRTNDLATVEIVSQRHNRERSDIAGAV
jgi:hypothetical protein